jgi:DNA-binding response OmpR family regulator
MLPDSLPKILVIEDESSVREGLVDSLSFEGYSVIWRENGKDGVLAYEQEKPDLVILDVMMPGLDGLEVCRRIRQNGTYTPIIILTAKCSEIDKVVGLEIGADDYLTKPFGMRELFARVKAILRRFSQVIPQNESVKEELSIQSPEELVFSDVIIDFKTYRAKKGDKSLTLSAKEFELIKYLSQHQDIPVSRNELLDHVWGYNSYPTTRTVDNFIARLRQKLEKMPDKPEHILTVHGIGYKFVSESSSSI